MNPRSMTTHLVPLTVAAQFLFLGWMAAEGEWIFRSGRVVYLRSAPIDPRDLFRGDFVRLPYESNSVRPERIDPTVSAAPREHKHHEVMYTRRWGCRSRVSYPYRTVSARQTVPVPVYGHDETSCEGQLATVDVCLSPHPPEQKHCHDANMLEILLQPQQEPDPQFEQLRIEAVETGRLCVVNAIVMDADRILILRRAPWKSFLPNCWDLPGGHVAPGESLEEALRREVKEEIGASVDTINSLIAVWDWERTTPQDRRRVRQFEFMVTLAEQPCHALRAAAHDFTEHRWIRESELPVMLENRAPGDTQMIQVLRRAYQLGGSRENPMLSNH